MHRGRKALFQPLGRRAFGDGGGHELLEQGENVAAANDGLVGHVVERMQQAKCRIVAGVDSAVKTLYSPLPYSSNLKAQGPIVKTRFAATNHRPVMGRHAFACAMQAGLDGLESDDTVQPGGGSA